MQNEPIFSQSSVESSNPWDRRNEIGLLNALIQTCTAVLFSPGKFYSRFEVKAGYGGPFLFYCLISIPIILLFFIERTLLAGVLPVPKSPAGPWEDLISFILIPFVFVYAFIMHLGVMLFGGKGGYRATFHVIAFNAPVAVWGLIPYLGPFIQGIWGIVLIVIGYRQVHAMGKGRAIMASLLLPIISLILLVAAIAIPNFLRAKTSADGAVAKATLRALSAAAETYGAAHEGKYPPNEVELVNGKYIDRAYCGQTIQGYTFACNFKDSGYSVIAAPTQGAGSGGELQIETGGAMSDGR